MVSRRNLLGRLPGALALTAAAAAAEDSRVPQAPFVKRDPAQRFAAIVDVADFAQASTGRAQTEALQAALDAGLAAGVPVMFPKGGYVIDGPLFCRNTSLLDMRGPEIAGAGMGQSVIEAAPFAGAALQVRGVGEGALRRSHFFLGGAIRDLEIRGARKGPLQHGLEVMAWWNGEISALRLQGFTGDAMRSIGDPGVDPNPDWTASILSIKGVKFERVGGWCFYNANMVGAPGWRWERCVFTLGGRGGLSLRSAGHQILQCGISAAGFLDESTAAPGEGIGVYLGWPANRTLIADCEFDTSKDIHLLLDFATQCDIERTRFIHNDRYGAGRLTPAVGVGFARGGEQPKVEDVSLRKIIFRIDTPGEMTGFKWYQPQRVRGVSIDGVQWNDQTAGRVKLAKYEGFDEGGVNVANNTRIRETGGVISAGLPAAFFKGDIDPVRLTAGAPARLSPWRAAPDYAALRKTLWPAAADGGEILPLTGWYDFDIEARADGAAADCEVMLAVTVGGRRAERRFGPAPARALAGRFSDRLFGQAGDTVAIEASAVPDGMAGVTIRASLLVRAA